MSLFDRAEEQKVICNICSKEISLKRTDEYTSELCSCGCLVWYPPKQGRPYGMRTFISKKDYMKSKEKKKEHKEHQQAMKDNPNIKIKVIKKSKLGRNMLQEPNKKDEQKIREYEEKKADVGV